MAMALISPPATQPVSLAKAKEFLKIENNDDDDLVGDLITQAVSHIENIAGQKLITQDWRIFFDDLPRTGILEIPLAPIIAPIEVRYYDDQGDAQIVSAQDYEFDRHSIPARLWIKTPICMGHQLNGFEVDVQAGFGVSSIEVPGDIIRALLLTIAHWYEFRGAVHPADQPLSNPAGLGDLLAPYKRIRL